MTEPVPVAFTKIDLSDPGYPQVIRDAFGRSSPRTLFVAGNRALLRGQMVGLLASREVDPGCLLKATAAFDAVTDAQVCVIGGWHSPLEAALLRRTPPDKVRLGILLANGCDHAVIPALVRACLERGEGFALTHCAAAVRRVTRPAALRRNDLIVALADVLLVPSAPPGSATLGAAKRAAADGKAVMTLDVGINRELLDGGAQRFSVTALRTALANIRAERP